jgi:hypothetical protein
MKVTVHDVAETWAWINPAALSRTYSPGVRGVPRLLEADLEGFNWQLRRDWVYCAGGHLPDTPLYVQRSPIVCPKAVPKLWATTRE